MSNFFITIFGAKEIYSSDEKDFSISKDQFFLINGSWIAIMEGKSISKKLYNHVAFKIAESVHGDNGS